MAVVIPVIVILACCFIRGDGNVLIVEVNAECVAVEQNGEDRFYVLRCGVAHGSAGSVDVSGLHVDFLRAVGGLPEIDRLGYLRQLHTLIVKRGGEDLRVDVVK